MATTRLNNIKIDGIAACVPKDSLLTKDYGLFSAKDVEIFIKNVGIVERRVAPDGITTSDLAFNAAEKLIADLNWDKKEIEVLIFVSQSPDYFLPATSILLQKRLGLSNKTLAFDVNLGCSGFVYGLHVLGSLLSASGFKKGLLLGGDKSTFSTCYEDKSTYPLFGDAGFATALSYSNSANPMFFNLQSDGKGEDAIKVLDGGSRNGVRNDTFDIVEIEPGIKRSRRHLILKGIDIFNFALKEVAPNIEELLSFSKKEKDDIDLFFFHQANKLINESIRKKLKITEFEKVPYSIQKYGNTSSASIPLTIVHHFQDETTSVIKNKKMLLSGFGVGYSWASCTLDSDEMIVSKLVEI